MDGLENIIDRFVNAFAKKPSQISVAVSGGPDSMALLWAVSKSKLLQKSNIHVLSVDHGLRAAAKNEIEMVAEYAGQCGKNFSHHILTRDIKDIGDTKIQEQARHDRYALMEAHCRAYEIEHLFLAHHLDDQGETFLFRLSKGSGIDGLCAMQPVSDYNQIRLCRPFLEIPKSDLISYCDKNGVPYCHDPSNDSDDFARVRLRKSYAILAEEGLTNKRLAKVAGRIARSKEALSFYADQAFSTALVNHSKTQIALEYEVMMAVPYEIRLRALQNAMDVLKPREGYPVRLEKLEALLDDIFSGLDMKRRTLGGLAFSVKNIKDNGKDSECRVILIELE